MSYILTLACGCVVHVNNESGSDAAPIRILQARGQVCGVLGHRVGLRVSLWELLPDPPTLHGLV